MEYTRTIERTFAAPAGLTLRVANRRGELVVRGEARDDIAVTAQIRVTAQSQREATDRLDAFDLPMHASAARVEIGPPRYDEPHPTMLFGIRLGRIMRGPRLDLLIRVPHACHVEAENASGQVRLESLTGGASIVSQRGAIRVQDLRGGTVVNGRTGSIEVRDIAGPLTVEARSGRIEVEGVQGDLSVRSRTGRIDLRQIQGACVVETRTGMISASDIDGPLRLRTRTGAVKYRGRVAHSIDIEVVTGAVSLAVTADSAFFIDAETRTGPVRSDLPVDFLRAPSDHAPTVRIRTRTGAIQIVPA